MPEITARRRLDQPLAGPRPVRASTRTRSPGSPSGSPGSWAPAASSPSRPCIVIVWIALNLFAVAWQWDPYPFILLNLAFSTQAAYAAPLILLAQNRQDDRDRDLAGRGPGPRRAHQGRHRVPGARAGGAAHRRGRGRDPRLPARRAGQAGRAARRRTLAAGRHDPVRRADRSVDQSTADPLQRGRSSASRRSAKCRTTPVRCVRDAVAQPGEARLGELARPRRARRSPPGSAATSPAFSSRSTSRVTPERDSSTASASSVIRSRRSGASASWTSTS